MFGLSLKGTLLHVLIVIMVLMHLDSARVKCAFKDVLWRNRKVSCLCSRIGNFDVCMCFLKDLVIYLGTSLRVVGV